MSRAEVTDVFVFAKGDSAVYIDPVEGDFGAGDRVRIIREGVEAAEAVIFPRDGSVAASGRTGRRPHALVKGFVCVVGDVIEAE
ncbi:MULTISPECIES: hypothetical protein [unclassified Streptomyces]|uniref:hypothetical protein n=1 Tax=unclassified Streptomyces TaxID=2593676 RepID=UPI00225B5ABC|nr:MULTISPECIES: hypothetical protein [unclassified Streptomyces]MCX4528063.1 hypothetical protein [Streptomyces sp. NBC_01551]MCX4541322.1 hypothetical protein [Streptomyces sp. NBC_01565]